MLIETYLEINYGKNFRISLYELSDHTWEYIIYGQKIAHDVYSGKIVSTGKHNTPGNCLDNAIKFCLSMRNII